MAAAGKEAKELQPEEVVVTLPMTADEKDSIADQSSDILNYVEEMKSAFLTGEKDIDAEWDGYLSELKSIGSEEVLQMYQTAYDRTK